MKRYLLALMVCSFAMAGMLVSETAFGALEVVCPPHAGDFPNEPGILDTDKGKITRIHNKTVRAVAQLACDADVCGNGIPEPGEQCDTGGESAACDVDCTAVFCGDGLVNVTAGEECDDGNTQDNDGCSASCLTEVAPVCGNGVLEGSEECDDGDLNDNNDCTNACLNPICGDGIAWNQQSALEECDEGGVNTATCDADCTLVECGDGVVNEAVGEQCDDGNNADGDGCQANCTLGCVDGTVQPCGSSVGECVQGTQTCSIGQFGLCEEEVGPSAEVCDELDNDCNGLTDDNCT